MKGWTQFHGLLIRPHIHGTVKYITLLPLNQSMHLVEQERGAQNISPLAEK